MEGSGGSSGIRGRQLGGRGGGIVWLSVTEMLSLQKSWIMVNGSDALESGTEAGSGGGSGGTLVVLTSQIQGDSIVDLRGGHGANGGGGAAGGHLLAKLLPSEDPMTQGLQQWTGRVLISGGGTSAGVQGILGDQGSEGLTT